MMKNYTRDDYVQHLKNREKHLKTIYGPKYEDQYVQLQCLEENKDQKTLDARNDLGTKLGRSGYVGQPDYWGVDG